MKHREIDYLTDSVYFRELLAIMISMMCRQSDLIMYVRDFNRFFIAGEPTGAFRILKDEFDVLSSGEQPFARVLWDIWDGKYTVKIYDICYYEDQLILIINSAYAARRMGIEGVTDWIEKHKIN